MRTLTLSSSWRILMANLDMFSTKVAGFQRISIKYSGFLWQTFCYYRLFVRHNIVTTLIEGVPLWCSLMLYVSIICSYQGQWTSKFTLWRYCHTQANNAVTTQPYDDITNFNIMMTSSNGNIVRVTGHLCGEFTGPRWIPHTTASDAELWCFLWSASE